VLRRGSSSSVEAQDYTPRNAFLHSNHDLQAALSPRGGLDEALVRTRGRVGLAYIGRTIRIYQLRPGQYRPAATLWGGLTAEFDSINFGLLDLTRGGGNATSLHGVG